MLLNCSQKEKLSATHFIQNAQSKNTNITPALILPENMLTLKPLLFVKDYRTKVTAFFKVISIKFSKNFWQF